MPLPRSHLTASAILAAIQYWRTRRLLPTVAPLLSGFLVDTDHLLDHQLYRRAPAGCEEQARKRMVLFLHGWEYFLLLAVAEAKILPARAATAHGLTLGYLVHLLMDQCDNQLEHPLAYSIVYRALTRFRGPYFKQNDARGWRRGSILRLWKWL